LALRSWWQFFASFAVKKNLTAKNAKDSQRMQSSAWFSFALLAAVWRELCGKKNLTANKPLIRKGRKATH